MAEFYVAEDDHQDFFERNPYQPYCYYYLAPKVKEFREVFRESLKQDIRDELEKDESEKDDQFEDFRSP